MHDFKVAPSVMSAATVYSAHRHALPVLPLGKGNGIETDKNGVLQMPVDRAALHGTFTNGGHLDGMQPGQPLPMSPSEAMRQYGYRLSSYEMSEIKGYPEIYFVGQHAQKVQGTLNAANNHGFDEESGDYILVEHDHVAYRYEVLDTLGKGSFGQVIKAFDHKTQTYVALKCIRNKQRFHQQAQVEVKVLDHIRSEDVNDNHHVVHMVEHFYFRHHLCITFELLSINLYELVKNNKFQGLDINLIRKIAMQMLCCLALLREKNIIHCDLKPENVLLKHPSRTSIKVIDFGSSCYKHEQVYTYIQSRFYRSPEVILGMPYDVSIDMWSFGCILAELFTGYPLFPGENETEQLAYAMEMYGVPPQRLIQQASRRHVFFSADGQPKLVPNSKGRTRLPNTKQLHKVLKCKDAAFLDLINRCLKWDAAQRLTPLEALRHPFFAPARPSAGPSPGPFQPLAMQTRSAALTATQPQKVVQMGAQRAHPIQTLPPQYTQPRVMPLTASLRSRGQPVAMGNLPDYLGLYAEHPPQYSAVPAVSYGSGLSSGMSTESLSIKHKSGNALNGDYIVTTDGSVAPPSLALGTT